MDTATPFVFDRDYKNTEQVRPYLADFLAVKRELTAAGKYPYNDSFKGKIPGLAGSTDKNEDTGIYLLQTLADLDDIRARAQAAIEAGAYRLAERLPAPAERGTLIRSGWYMGGTGWKEIASAQVKLDEQTGRVLFRLPRQKNWRTFHDGPSAYLFKPVSA